MKKRKTKKNNAHIILIVILIGIIVIGAVSFIQDDTSNTTSTSTTNDLEPLLYNALQDEYHAEAVYQKVISDFGKVRPYVNIVRAERRHSQSIEALYTTYGLTIPTNEWEDITTMPSFDSLQEACQISAQAERDNIALYEQLLPSITNQDVKTVFTNNMLASQNNHLPAFTRCS